MSARVAHWKNRLRARMPQPDLLLSSQLSNTAYFVILVAVGPAGRRRSLLCLSRRFYLRANSIRSGLTHSAVFASSDMALIARL